MKRTAEKALSIIGAAITALSIVFGLISLALFKAFRADPVLRADFESGLLEDPAITPDDIEVMNWFMNGVAGFGWFIIIGLFISFILTIIGIVSVWNNKKPKLAGAMFIIGGLFAGFISLTSILLYIAGILCFTKKPPIIEDTPFEINEDDIPMRPL